MRTFDDVEQELIKRLKNSFDNGIYQNFLSLLDNDLINKKIVRNDETNSVYVYFDESVYYPNNDEEASSFINEVNIISRLLVKTIFLIQYLENNGYIFTYDEGTSINEFSRIIQGRRSIQFEILDKTVCKLINEYFSKTIVISQEIVDLVNDNFIAKDEIRHNQNLKITKLGIWIAIITGVASLIFSTYGIYQSNQSKSQKVEIDSVQYQKAEKIMNSVIDNQKATKNKIDTMSTYLHKIKK